MSDELGTMLLSLINILVLGAVIALVVFLVMHWRRERSRLKQLIEMTEEVLDILKNRR